MSDTSTALAVRPRQVLGDYRPPPEAGEFKALVDLSNYLAKVPGFLPGHFFGQPYKILAAMLYGRDLNISTTNALQHIQVIEGKAGADALLMGMLVQRAGHKLDPCLDRKVPGQSRTCRITRGDTGVSFETTWTMDMARAANLASKNNWKAYPDSMLWARALSQTAREACPDALMGIGYTPEEIGGEVIEGQVVDLGYEGVPVLEAVSSSMGMQGAPSPAPVVTTPPDVSPAAVLDHVSQVVAEVVSQGVSGEQSAGPVTAAPAEAASTMEVPKAPGDAPVVAVSAAAPSSPPPGATTPTSPAAPPERSARSVGPRAKRTNVVAAPQTAETPAMAPEVAAQPIASEPPAAPADAPPQPAEQPLNPVSLLDEVPEPAAAQEDDGRAVYLASLRDEVRKGAAMLHLLRTKLKNQKAALASQPMLPEPPRIPNPDSDESLRLFIDSNYPSRTVADLREGELENVLGVIQGLVDRIEQTGVKA